STTRTRRLSGTAGSMTISKRTDGRSIDCISTSRCQAVNDSAVKPVGLLPLRMVERQPEDLPAMHTAGRLSQCSAKERRRTMDGISAPEGDSKSWFIGVRPLSEQES